VPRDLATATVQSLKKAGFKVLMPWPDEEPPSAAETPDLFLWESSPKSTGLPGGSGRTHPMLFPPPAPFLLAGGLDGCNVKERWAAMPPDARRNCLGFDAASRLEETPGRKSPHKVTAFVQESHSLR
jgi:phosphoribosylanthranilate isomerase